MVRIEKKASSFLLLFYWLPTAPLGYNLSERDELLHGGFFHLTLTEFGMEFLLKAVLPVSTRVL